MRISYNAPFTLTFAFICVGVFILDQITGGRLIFHLFSVQPSMSWANPVSFIRLITHVFGHISAEHLVFNLAIILLLGPMLEQKYGLSTLIILSVVVAAATGAFTALLLPYGLLGASGIAFLLIILGSYTRARSGAVPLTFIVVAVLFLGNEIWQSFTRDDNIAHFAHIIGGLVGGLYGHYRGR